MACALFTACARAPIRTQSEAISTERQRAIELIAAVENLNAEGVPKDHYDVAALESAAASDDPKLIRARIYSLFGQIASEMSGGLTPLEARLGWRMESSSPGADAISALAEDAFNRGKFAEAFAALAPAQEQYALLKRALNAEGVTADAQARLRLNMDRWRWMPRDLGADYILVNVPAFEVVLVRDSAVAARRRVVTGTRKLQTPQFSALVTGVILNPTWFVPSSIVKESVGALMKNNPDRAQRLGYYVGDDGGVRQKPGPTNALGQMKLVMPNPYSVFLHDTPSKDAFERENRALSHGCVRVDDALGFARILLGDAVSDEDFANFIATRRTTEIDLPAALPVYVVYLTAYANEDGAVDFYPDVYGLDASLLAQFGGAAKTDPDPIKSLIEESCPEIGENTALPDNL